MVFKLLKEGLNNNPKLKEEQSDRLQDKKEKLEISKKARQHFDTLLANEDILWTYDIDYTIFDDPNIIDKESFLLTYIRQSSSEKPDLLEKLFSNFSKSFNQKVQSTLPHDISSFKLVELSSGAEVENYTLRSNPFMTLKMFWTIIWSRVVKIKYDSSGRVTINPMLLLDGFKYNRLLEVHDWDPDDTNIPTTYNTFVDHHWHLNWPTLI